VSKPIIWNYGGGKQSVAIAVLITQGKLPVPERAVIADTGREVSSTWRYLKEHAQPLLDRVGLRVEIVPHSYALHDLYSTEGKPLMPMFTGDGGQLGAFCSGEWKRDAVLRWLREPERGYGPKNPVVQWIGYSRDEIGRCKPSRRKWADVQWPLLMGYGLTLSRQDCVNVILDAGLPEPRKSRCKMCPFTRNEEWLDQKESDPADHIEAITIDREIRALDRDNAVYLHESRVPLELVDLRRQDKPEHPLFGRGENCDSAGCFT